MSSELNLALLICTYFHGNQKIMGSTSPTPLGLQVCTYSSETCDHDHMFLFWGKRHPLFRLTFLFSIKVNWDGLEFDGELVVVVVAMENRTGAPVLFSHQTAGMACPLLPPLPSSPSSPFSPNVPANLLGITLSFSRSLLSVAPAHSVLSSHVEGCCH